MKSSTDIYWNARANSVKNDTEVNIMDVFQRNIEYDYISRFLEPLMNVLEVGCGNGFSTDRFRKHVKHVDAFDYSENMIARAKAQFGEINNRFFIDNILSPSQITGAYDTVLCVRVLINLRNLEEQHIAIHNLASFLNPGGRLILLEGFTEVFRELDVLRTKLALPPLEPAKINFYPSLKDILPTLNTLFQVQDSFHLGAYDFLTRVVYPLLVGHENVKHNTIFSEKCDWISRVFNPECFEHLSRLKGFLLEKKRA